MSEQKGPPENNKKNPKKVESNETTCSVCKEMKRKCVVNCVYARHFPHDEPAKLNLLKHRCSIKELGKELRTKRQVQAQVDLVNERLEQAQVLKDKQLLLEAARLQEIKSLEEAAQSTKQSFFNVEPHMANKPSVRRPGDGAQRTEQSYFRVEPRLIEQRSVGKALKRRRDDSGKQRIGFQFVKKGPRISRNPTGFRSQLKGAYREIKNDALVLTEKVKCFGTMVEELSSSEDEEETETGALSSEEEEKTEAASSAQPQNPQPPQSGPTPAGWKLSL